MGVEKKDISPVISKLEKSEVKMPEGFNKLVSKVGETIHDKESITEKGFVELDTFLSIGTNEEDSHIDNALADFLQKQLIS